MKEEKENTMVLFDGTVSGNKTKTDKFKKLLKSLVKANKGKVEVSD